MRPRRLQPWGRLLSRHAPACALPRASQVAGTYFVNDNATSVAMDVFKGILEESGITGFDDDLAKYSKQSTVDEYLAEFVTDTPDAGAPGACFQAG